MGKSVQILVRSKDCTEYGFPKKLGIYHVGEARQIGQYYNVSVLVIRESDLHLHRPPVQLQAQSIEAARELVIRHYKDLASDMKLDILITDLADSC